MTSLMESIQSGFKRIGSRLSLTNHHSNNMNNNNSKSSSSSSSSTTTSTSTSSSTTTITSNTTTTSTSLKSERNNMLSPAPPPPSSQSSLNTFNEKQKLSTTYNSINSINNNHHNNNTNNNTNNSKMERISSVPVITKNIKKQSTIAPCEVEALAKRLMMNNNNMNDSTSTSNNTSSSDTNNKGSTNTCFHAPLNIVTATACCPKKPNKSRETPTRRDCGEDAVFVCRHFPKNEKMDEKNAKIEKIEKIEKPIDRVCCIGVADGVGSYMLRGIDPSIFAWAIMEETKRVFESEKYISCIDALTKSYNRICDERLVSAGGSTACIISMHHGVHCETGMPVLKLTAATIGDSAFMVYRNGKIIYRSVEQLHGFNCPYQLSVPRLVDVTKNENLDGGGGGRRNRNGMMVKQDDPSRAIVIEDEPIDLMRDDVVIVSTDGLTDNVFDEEVAQILSENMKAGMTPKEMAAKMASELLRTAYVKSRSKDSFTPFTKYALEHRQNYVPNGKIDDITFVVAIVS